MIKKKRKHLSHLARLWQLGWTKKSSAFPFVDVWTEVVLCVWSYLECHVFLDSYLQLFFSFSFFFRPFWLEEHLTLLDAEEFSRTFSCVSWTGNFGHPSFLSFEIGIFNWNYFVGLSGRRKMLSSRYTQVGTSFTLR